MSVAKRLKLSLSETEENLFGRLNDDALAHIFKFLSGKERLPINLVNKQWSSILNWRELMKDVVLKLEFCIISPNCPPWTTLMTSERKFVTLEIGKRVEFGDENTTDDFWKSIGQSIETIYCRNTKEVPLNFLKKFPKLKNVVGNSLQEILTIPMPQAVEHFHILGTLDNWISKEEKKKLKQMKHLKALTASQIEVNEWCEDEESELFEVSDRIMEMSQSFYIDGEDVYRTHYSDIVKIASVNMLQITELKFRDILTFTGFFYCDKNFSENISNFVSLQELRLIISPYSCTECFFTHDEFPSKLPSVRSVQVSVPWEDASEDWYSSEYEDYDEYYDSPRRCWYEYKPCSTCLSNLIECCPNIESWKISGPTKVYPFLEVTVKPLKKLNLKMGNTEYGFQKHFEYLEELRIGRSHCMGTYMYDVKCKKDWPTMLHLKKITFGKTIEMKKLSHWRNLIEKTPKITEAIFKMKVPPEVLAKMEDNWPMLEKLRFWKDKDACFDKDDYEKAFSGKFKYIREIEDREEKSEEQGYEMFKKYSSLRRYSNYCYDDFCRAEIRAKNLKKGVEIGEKMEVTDYSHTEENMDSTE